MNKEILEYSLCKRLYDAGVRVETEKYRTEKSYIRGELKPVEITKIPKVSIVDGLELINKNIDEKSGSIQIGYKYFGFFPKSGENEELHFSGKEYKSLKDCVEKSLVYLLDNGLIK